MAIAAPTGSSNVTTYTSNSSASAALTKPTNVATGDVLIAAIWARSNTTDFTLPSGWTAIQATTETSAATVGIIRFYSHVVTDATTEPGTNTWSAGTAGRVSGVLFRVTGANTTTPVDVIGAEATAVADGAGGTLLTLPAISPTGPADLLVAVTGAQIVTGGTRGQFVAPAGFTRIGTTATTTGAAEQDFAVDVQVLTGSGTTGTKAFTRSAATALGIGYLIAIKAILGLVGLINGQSSVTINATAGAAVTFVASSTGGNGNTVTYGWDWGDGQTTAASTTTSVTHTYASAGTYTVTMTPYQS